MNRLVLADIASHNIEGRSVGHFFALARNYQEMFPDCKIAGGPVYCSDGHFDGNKMLLLPFDTLHSYNKIIIKWRQFRNIYSLMHQAEDDFVVFQQAATATAMFSLFFIRKRCKKLFFICYDNDPVDSFVKRIFYKIIKRKIDGIICPNDKVGHAFNLPYCVVPDYIYCSENKIKPHKYNDRKYDMAILGRLTEEKGSIEVANIFNGTNVEVLIAGRPESEEIKKSLEKAAEDSPNIHLHLGYLTADEYDNYLASIKFAILNYQGEYSERSSGVVYDMLYHYIPVIGRKCDALQFIEDNQCGYLFEELFAEDIQKLINKNNHAQFLEGIDKYKHLQTENIEKLKSFIIK